LSAARTEVHTKMFVAVDLSISPVQSRFLAAIQAYQALSGVIHSDKHSGAYLHICLPNLLLTKLQTHLCRI